MNTFFSTRLIKMRVVFKFAFTLFSLLQNLEVTRKPLTSLR